MSFVCVNCEEEVSSTKMAGLVFGQLSRSFLEGKGILSEQALKARFSSGDFTSGFLSGLGVSCPKCGKTNWK